MRAPLDPGQGLSPSCPRASLLSPDKPRPWGTPGGLASSAPSLRILESAEAPASAGLWHHLLVTAGAGPADSGGAGPP